MITQGNEAPATAPASPAPSAENPNPVNPNPTATQDGSTPSAADTTTTEDPDSSEGYDPFASLDELGANASPDGTVSSAPTAAPVAEVTPEADPALATADPEAEASVDPATGEKPPATNYRLSLKGATDADSKRSLIQILRDEPGTTLAEAARRAGVKPEGQETRTPSKDAPATEPAPAAASSVDPLKPLRDEIAGLKADAKKARGEFDYDKALDLQEQITEKQSELTRRESVAAIKEEERQAQQKQAHTQAVNNTWAEVAEDYPDAGKEGSALHSALVREIENVNRNKPDLFQDSEWPAILTYRVARKLGLKPNAPAASAPAAPALPPGTTTTTAPKTSTAPAVTPRKASVPAAVAPSPAPGGAVSGSASAVPSGPYDPFEEMDRLEAAGARK